MPANSRAGTLQGVLDGQCHRDYTATPLKREGKGEKVR